MIAGMRLSRVRAAAVLLLAVLHVGAGVVSALALCCADSVHAPKTPMMECHEMGVPGHVCPFMPHGAPDAHAAHGAPDAHAAHGAPDAHAAHGSHGTAPAGGRLMAGCPAGHDQGVPVIGFTFPPPAAAPAPRPEVIAVNRDTAAEAVIVRGGYPTTPPPKRFL